MRLIDNDNGVDSFVQLLKKETVQGVKMVFFSFSFRNNAEVFNDGLEKFEFGELGIENKRGVNPVLNFFEERPAKCGFPRADFPRNRNESAPALDAVEKSGERFAVMAAEINEARIRRDVERSFFEPEKILIH